MQFLPYFLPHLFFGNQQLTMPFQIVSTQGLFARLYIVHRNFLVHKQMYISLLFKETAVYNQWRESSECACASM